MVVGSRVGWLLETRDCWEFIGLESFPVELDGGNWERWRGSQVLGEVARRTRHFRRAVLGDDGMAPGTCRVYCWLIDASEIRRSKTSWGIGSWTPIYLQGFFTPFPTVFGLRDFWTNSIILVVSNIFYFHSYLGKWSHLTNIFQMGWNHQLGIILESLQVSPYDFLFWQTNRAEDILRSLRHPNIIWTLEMEI